MRRIARLAALGAAFLAAANGPARAEDVGWSGPRSLGQRLYVPGGLHRTNAGPT